jgi:hypothetical protein
LISQPGVGKQLINYGEVSSGEVAKKQKEGTVRWHGEKYADL